MSDFRAFLIEQNSQRQHAAGFVRMREEQLDAGDVLIRVAYSSINYKDALAASGQGRIIRRFPCIAGVDLAGIVERSATPRFAVGDAVIATSYDIGVAHHGGYAELALLPGAWVLPLPPGLSLRDAMAVGTAGFTAALGIQRMEENGLKPENGVVLVSGASGGVGSLAIDMLAARGYEVHALTGKPEQVDYLQALGAARVLLRSELDLAHIKPLDKGLWAGAIDTLGAAVLAWLLATTKPAGCVASIGLAAGHELNTTVMPFILRGVSLLGVDSAYVGAALREKVWARLASDLKPRHLQALTREVDFDELPAQFAAFLAGAAHGRVVVRIQS